MKISTKGRYALRLMMDVASHDEAGYVSLKDVAVRQNISPKYLEQIAGLLAKAGLLRSGRGAQGGYRLAKEPEAYSVGSILVVTLAGVVLFRERLEKHQWLGIAVVLAALVLLNV